MLHQPTGTLKSLTRKIWKLQEQYFSPIALVRTAVADAYQQLTIPKLRIQGTADLPFFETEFSKFYEQAPEPKTFVSIEGGDSLFNANRMARSDDSACIAMDCSKQIQNK
jgi:fermentation-respiration switch protein FrsA (DUF1100 family)